MSLGRKRVQDAGGVGKQRRYIATFGMCEPMVSTMTGWIGFFRSKRIFLAGHRLGACQLRYNLRRPVSDQSPRHRNALQRTYVDSVLDPTLSGSLWGDSPSVAEPSEAWRINIEGPVCCGPVDLKDDWHWQEDRLTLSANQCGLKSVTQKWED